MNTPLIKRGSASDIIARRDRTVELMSQAASLLIEAAGLGILSPMQLDQHTFWLDKPDDLPRFIERVTEGADHGGWSCLVNACDLRQLMDATAFDAFNKQLADKPPTLNTDNVDATFSQLAIDAEMIFKRGLVSTFKRLDFKAFKTNSALKFGKKIIMTGAITSWGWSHYGVKEATMLDLERVFHTLDGQKMPERNTAFASVISNQAHRVGREGGERIAEDNYFHAKWFKNGNLHLTFKRLDILQQCNDIIAEVYNGNLGHDTNPAKGAHNFN